MQRPRVIRSGPLALLLHRHTMQHPSFHLYSSQQSLSDLSLAHNYSFNILEAFRDPQSCTLRPGDFLLFQPQKRTVRPLRLTVSLQKRCENLFARLLFNCLPCPLQIREVTSRDESLHFLCLQTFSKVLFPSYDFTN